MQADDAVKVTTYVRRGRASLIVLANFGRANVTLTLAFDWAALGLTAATAALRVPP